MNNEDACALKVKVSSVFNELEYHVMTFMAILKKHQ